MEYQNILAFTTRHEFRKWLEENSSVESECYLFLTRGSPVDNEHFWYLDAVEEALCFGWIDSTIRMISGKAMQRFSPRRATSGWTELNKERVRRLEKVGLMTEAGRAVLPPMGKRSFNPDKEVVAALKAAGVWSRFRTFHPLYQRIRLSNLAFCKVRHPSSYARMLSHVIEETRKGRRNRPGHLSCPRISARSKRLRRQVSHPVPVSQEAPWLSSEPHAHQDSTIRCFRTRHKTAFAVLICYYQLK